MDETATHDLLLDMAGWVDDDLLAWARELVAVGETQHALELLGATLAADRVELPPASRSALVDAARAVRTELDLDRVLPAPVADDGGARHRFGPSGPAEVAGAVRALPARLLAGCRLLLAHRVTPAGSAPGPLPHPVLLVEVAPGDRDRDLVAYQLADALDRAGVRVSVEVISTDRPLPAYHAAALRSARPLRPAEPDGAEEERPSVAPAGAAPEQEPGLTEPSEPDEQPQEAGADPADETDADDPASAADPGEAEDPAEVAPDEQPTARLADGYHADAGRHPALLPDHQPVELDPSEDAAEVFPEPQPIPAAPALSVVPEPGPDYGPVPVGSSGDRPIEPGLFDRIGSPGPARRERQHRYLIERPDRELPGVAAAAGAGNDFEPEPATAGPLLQSTGNTQPLPVRIPDDRRFPEPHPTGPGPAGGGPAPGDLGLRPDSVARLSASGRELLARLQAELQNGGPAGPHAAGGLGSGGLSPNGGGASPNGSNRSPAAPPAAVDPPDLAD